MDNLINGRTPEEIKSGLRNMLESCADISGVKDTICREMCCSYDGDNCCHETILMGALALIERLESERDAALAKVPKWISVEERLPEGECLAIGWQHEMLIGNVYLSGAGYACESDGEYLMDVTRWMPLPEPPEEDE